MNRIVRGVSWYVSYRGSAYRYTPSVSDTGASIAAGLTLLY